jgi:spoIIIJ-associated protein
MRSVETEGATIDEAIDRALELLHIERDRVDIEILENAQRGLLGFGGKKARIRARVRNPLSAETVTAPSPVSQETELRSGWVGRATDDVLAEARSCLAEILRHLGIEPDVEMARNGDGIWCFRLPGSGAGIVIGRYGQTLDAIEYLLNRIAAKAGDGSLRIALDVEGYRERRQDSVEQMARRAADKARQTGRAVMLAPMSPRDRRTVHVALAEERGVTTRSQGEGSFRRVVVVPNRTAGRPAT